MQSEERRDRILQRARELASTGEYQGWQAVADQLRGNEGRCEARRVLERGPASAEIDHLCHRAMQIRDHHA